MDLFDFLDTMVPKWTQKVTLISYIISWIGLFSVYPKLFLSGYDKVSLFDQIFLIVWYGIVAVIPAITFGTLFSHIEVGLTFLTRKKIPKEHLAVTGFCDLMLVVGIIFLSVVGTGRAGAYLLLVIFVAPIGAGLLIGAAVTVVSVLGIILASIGFIMWVVVDFLRK